ncbi:protein FAM131C isoform X2 [Varanus komodoensis]|uniref:protein FAM131C isoform X2 n=1 Tax=Varanus komodoensis TaxID=61221 RepID=UPI001CF76A7A|nr:protein FAM131C isoform X2 [Varanus komodoensis]
MGSCVAKEFLTGTQKEQPTVTPPPLGRSWAPRGGHSPSAAREEDAGQECVQASGSIRSCSGSSSAYHVAALATSSLVGLIQTIRDHVTKPTAMAQGRVAHLIEWKGWSAPLAGREHVAPHKELYEGLPDALKEARFAAGVAEQFAITEATLDAWPSLDGEELQQGGTAWDVVQLQDLGSLCLQENALSSVSSPVATDSLHADSGTGCGSPVPQKGEVARDWHAQRGSSGKPRAGPQREELGCVPQGGTLTPRDLDSGSLSEDDVFYN